MRAPTFLVTLLCGAGLAHPGAAGRLERVPSHRRLSKHDATDNCAEPSPSPTYWRISDLVLKIYNWDDGGSMGTFGFKSYYSARNTTVECIAKDVDLAKLADGPWSPCDTPGIEFRFDLSEISLTVRETWTCSGPPGMVFKANATGHIMLHGCLDNKTDKGVESDCNLMELEMAANATWSAMT